MKKKKKNKKNFEDLEETGRQILATIFSISHFYSKPVLKLAHFAAESEEPSDRGSFLAVVYEVLTRVLMISFLSIGFYRQLRVCR